MVGPGDQRSSLLNRPEEVCGSSSPVYLCLRRKTGLPLKGPG